MTLTAVTLLNDTLPDGSTTRALAPQVYARPGSRERQRWLEMPPIIGAPSVTQERKDGK